MKLSIKGDSVINPYEVTDKQWKNVKDDMKFRKMLVLRNALRKASLRIEVAPIDWRKKAAASFLDFLRVVSFLKNRGTFSYL